VVHKNQVKRSITLSKASPGEYSTYIYMSYGVLSLYFMQVMYCALHIGFLDDADRLHGSTPLYITLL
jgi:hypothetical protein